MIYNHGHFNFLFEIYIKRKKSGLSKKLSQISILEMEQKGRGPNFIVAG